MGIEAMVIGQLVSGIMGAKAASDEAKANIANEESAEKSRALVATQEFNDMMAANVVAGATSGISLASASFIEGIKTGDMNFRLNAAAERITVGNRARAYMTRANNAKKMAVISGATSLIGGYNQASKLAKPVQPGVANSPMQFGYFGMNFKP
jgi:uncharacterized protein (DUF2147 family)